MKYFFPILMIAGLLVFSSCGDDNDPETGDATILNYDGDNVTAPNLPAGFYEFGVRFPVNTTRNVVGRQLEAVSFYLYQIPNELVITLSNDATASAPSDIIYSQAVTNPQANSWNTINLNTPYTFEDNRSLWIGIQIDHNQTALQTVGCDAGPANPNGDFLYDDADQSWLSFRDRVGDSVNWNIRALISQ